MANIFFKAYKVWHEQEYEQALDMMNNHFEDKFGGRAFPQKRIRNFCAYLKEERAFHPVKNRFDMQLYRFLNHELELPFGVVYCELWRLNPCLHLLAKLEFLDPIDLLYEPFVATEEDIISGHQLYLVPPLFAEYAQQGLLLGMGTSNLGLPVLALSDIERMDEDSFGELKTMLRNQLKPIFEALPNGAWQRLAKNKPMLVVRLFLRDHFLLPHDNIETERWMIKKQQFPDSVDAVLNALTTILNDDDINDKDLTTMVQLDGGFYEILDGRYWLTELLKRLKSV